MGTRLNEETYLWVLIDCVLVSAVFVEQGDCLGMRIFRAALRGRIYVSQITSESDLKGGYSDPNRVSHSATPSY